MKCERCGHSNPEGQKYCGECGAPLDSIAGPVRAAIDSSVRQEVASALSTYTKNQRIAEFDITEKVTDRLIGWGKVAGIVLGLAITGAGYLGFKSFQDVVDGLKKDLRPLADDAKKNAAELNALVNAAKGEVELIGKQSAALKANIAQMEQEAKPIHDQLAKLESDSKEQKQTISSLQSRVSDLDISFRALPKPSAPPPYHLSLERVIGGKVASSIQQQGVLTFQVTGDTGGVQDPVPQLKVANAMEAQFGATDATRDPSFLYLLGDNVYFNGEQKEYYNQFYGPYAHYVAPIFAIPGNHDGQNLGTDSSLAAFMANFCAPEAVHRPEAGDSVRKAMTQPNTYWTLETPLATIIGLYTNVPEGGVIDDVQQDWLVHELESAPQDKALILALHHPPVSFDNFQGGSSHMADAMERAFNKSRRVPNLILSAHVNNYQRIEVELAPRLVVPFFIVGTGGYHYLRTLARGSEPRPTPPVRAKAGKLALVAGIDDRHGFVTFEISRSEIKGHFIGIRKDSDTPAPADEFTYSAKAILLEKALNVSLNAGGAPSAQP
jgi:hypothetical protein